MTDALSLQSVVCRSLEYEHLPEFDVYSSASWAVKDTIERVEPTAGVMVNPEEYA